MAYVPVPKDLNRVKTKVMFNLTKRQIVCFSLALAVGVRVKNSPHGTSGHEGRSIIKALLFS